MTTSVPEQESTEFEWTTARPTRLKEALVRTFLFPRMLVRHWDLIATSVRRELEARFTGTILGWVWPLVHPMFIFTVYYFVFAKLLSFKFGDLPPGYEAAMGVYMFVAIAAFTAIAETMTRGTGMIIDNGNLIKKLAFPSEILALNLTLANAVTLLFTITVFLAACWFTPLWPAPGIELLWIFAILPVQLMFTFGITLGLSTLHVFFRDTIQVVAMAVTAWMFATPLFWCPPLIGDSIEPFLKYIEMNPLYHCIEAWRGALMGELSIVNKDGVVDTYVSSELIGWHLLQFLPWAVGVYICGHVFFVMAQRRFADEV